MSELDYGATRVLVVEDEDFTRKIIRSLLHQLGVRHFHEATDGKAGLLEVLRVRPQLVLCDIHMKPVNGLQFLKSLREAKIPAIASTPVVFLTSDSQTDTVMLAKEQAVDGYLVKPVSLAQLKRKIDSVLGPKPILPVDPS
jgi:two-component system chemotaxis response regulator CheY